MKNLIQLFFKYIFTVFAWVIIPIEFHYQKDIFSFRSWNLFVLLSAVPALLTALWLIVLPETPKYLAENGKRKKLLKVLTRMYVVNTGKTAEEFKV